MGTCDPERDHLKRQQVDALELIFAEIERMLGPLLPKSADRCQWWTRVAHGGSTHVQRETWRAAAFYAFLYAGRDRVRSRGVH